MMMLLLGQELDAQYVMQTQSINFVGSRLQLTWLPTEIFAPDFSRVWLRVCII
jgi:hypothetical protein